MTGQKCAFQDCDRRQGPGDIWTTIRIEGRGYEVCDDCADNPAGFSVVGGALVREK